MDLMTNLMSAAAEIFLLVMVSIILIADLLIKQSGRLVTYLLVQLTLLGCSLITVGTHENGVIHAFNNMYVDDLMSDVLKLLTYLAMSMMLVYSRQYLTVRGLFSGEFMALALFAMLGMMVMISASHFLTLYLGLELLSLSLYAMVALATRFRHRHRSRDEILHPRRAGFRLVAVRHVHVVRRDRFAGTGCSGKRNPVRHCGQEPAGIRPGVRGLRPGFQARRRAIPYVGAGRVPRRSTAMTI